MNEITLQPYEIDSHNLLEQLISCAKTRTREYWEKRLPLHYSDILATIVMEHPIIDQFKFFTIYPACLYFYIDDRDNLIKEAVCVKSKLFDENEFVVRPDTMILLGIFKRDDGRTVIRYADTTHDILT